VNVPHEHPALAFDLPIVSQTHAAKARLQKLINELMEDHPDAAASLKEGLDETLTLHSIAAALAQHNAGIVLHLERITQLKENTQPGRGSSR